MNKLPIRLQWNGIDRSTEHESGLYPTDDDRASPKAASFRQLFRRGHVVRLDFRQFSRAVAGHSDNRNRNASEPNDFGSLEAANEPARLRTSAVAMRRSVGDSLSAEAHTKMRSYLMRM